MANSMFAKFTKALAVIMATVVFTAAQPVQAQDANNPYAFEKKAYKPDGTPWVGPVNVGDTVKYVLSYKPGATNSGPVTINDQLSPNLSYVGPTNSSPGWTWGSSPYSAGNAETYNHPGFGPGSGSVKLTVTGLPAPTNGEGDGTIPVPIGNRVFGVFHHSDDSISNIDCWDLATLTKCTGSAQANSTSGFIHTPNTPHSIVRGSNLYFLGAKSGTATIGCFNGPANAACAETSLPVTVSSASQLSGLVEDGGGQVYSAVKDKLLCRKLSGSIWIDCLGWATGGITTVPSTTPFLNVYMIPEFGPSPSRVYISYGTKVQCIELATQLPCAGWGPGGVAGGGFILSSIPGSGATSDGGVCLWSGSTIGQCFDRTGATLTGTSPSVPGGSVYSAFRLPGTAKVFLPSFDGSSGPVCVDFTGATGAACAGYTPQAPASAYQYGFAVDPSKPEKCMLSLGHNNFMWRFDYNTGEIGCGSEVFTTPPIDDLYCSGKPDPAQFKWISFTVSTPGANGTLVVKQGTTTVYSGPVSSALTNLTTVAIGATPLTVSFTPTSGNPASIEVSFSYTSDKNPEICYQATVKECGVVSNTAVMKGALPAAFSASQTVDLGKAKGEKCDPVIPPVEYSCLSADPKVTCGKTPGTYVVTLTPNSTGSTSPSEFEVTVLTPGVSIQNAQPKYIIGPSGQLQLTLIGANPGDVIEFDISGSQADPKSKDGMSICCVDKIKITIPADLDCTEKQVVDLAIEKKGRKGSATQPNGFIFDLAVTNVGGAIASPAPIQVTDTVPPGMSFSAASGTDWSCGTLPAAAGSTITCTYTGVGNVAAGASLPPIQIQATALGEAPWKPFKNCANVGLSSNATYAETTLANNKSCVVVKDKDEKDPPTISVTKSCTLPTEANAAVVNSKINCQITVTATGSPLPPTINVQESLISNSTSATLSTASISSTEAWSCIPLAGAPVASGTPIDCNLPSSSLPANGVSVLNVTLLVNGPLEPGEAQNCVVGMMQNADGEIATHQQDGTDIPLVTDMQCIPLAQPDGLTVTKVCDPAMPAEGQVDSPGDVVVQCMITVSGAGNLPPVIEVKELLQGVSHPNNAIVQLNSNQNWTMPALPVALGSVGSMTLPSADLMAAGGTSTIAVTLTLNDMGMASETQNCVSGSGGADAASLQEMSPQVCVPFVPQPTGVLKVRKEVINNADFPITGLQYNMTVSCTGNPIPTMSQTIVDGETLDFQSYTPGTECTVQEDPPPATEACGGMTPRWTTTYLPPTTLTNFPNGGTVVVRNTLDCDCPPGHSKGNGKCTKVIDPPKCDTKSAKLSGDSCRCIIRGMVPVSKTSCACPDGQQLKNGACVVPPPPPPKCDARTAKLSGNRCVCTVRGMVPVSKTSCDCPKGQDVRNGKCAPPPPPPPRCDGVTAKAKGNACACTFRNMVPVSKSACACRKGFDFKPGQGCVRRPPLCERGASFNPRRERCEPICGPGTQYNPKRNACIVERRDCPRGQVFIPRLGKCVGFERECPEGTVKFGPVCRPVKGDRDVDNGERCVNREGKEIPC